MATVALIVVLVLLAALAVFQLALAAGAPLGHFAWGGQNKTLPTRLRISSLVSVVIYALIALVALERARAIDLMPGGGVEGVAMWVIAVYFTLGIVLNGISRSRPERFTMTPVVTVLAVASVILALS